MGKTKQKESRLFVGGFGRGGEGGGGGRATGIGETSTTKIKAEKLQLYKKQLSQKASYSIEIFNKTCPFV